MFNRGMLFLIVLGAAIVVPYVMFDDGLSKTAKSEYQRFFGGSGATADSSSSSFSWFQNQPPQLPLDQGPALPPVSLEEALRMDISPVWVTSRWARVSTVLGDTDQMGMRVALVSGTQSHDVAGSLTYYFDKHHQLQRVTFTGLTGDESRVITHLMNKFGLRPVPTVAAGLYQAPAGAGKTSMAQVNHLPVVRASEANSRCELAVDLYRPGPIVPVSAAKQPEQPRGQNTPGPRIW
ncbi:hypothetical protein ETAA8_47230 [Anatilimnocola aggregata]|uniref:DUF6690 domain-containing protein n=1 Tax=Anatilimnocola aggregata TaxID=2528021 RepID=A0A517YHB7_9BACT|nr:DUF6690 family protein [Anatilimnocola aggregata]QDU29608.1 hypothetical protein ETAA8_47230 [Anatilimnocola aggregata]